MSEWAVYLLVNEWGRTYIGSTTDPRRRLRQHNSEIVGGARSTRGKGPWRIYLYIAGFEDRSSACRWEKLLKSRARGLEARAAAFHLVAKGECPPYRKRAHYDVPLGLVITVMETLGNGST